MNFNIKIFLLCPIPEEQKPINEYITLKQNFLTKWLILSNKEYQKRLLFTFLGCFCVLMLFQWPPFEFSRSFFHMMAVQSFETFFVLIFLFLIIFARWKQIEKRFHASRLFYEEASWYDGQIWEKPFSILKNDRLINSQKIRPLLLRNQRTLFFLMIFLFLFENLSFSF
jgi:hypothetical protein